MSKNIAISNFQFVAFDFETTGLNPSVDRIVECAAVRFTLQEVISDFHSLANPGRSIPQKATQVHGIREHDVANERPVADVVLDFYHYIGDAVLVAHNMKFDFDFLQSELQRRDPNISVTNTLIDTVFLARKAFPALASYRLEALIQSLRLAPRKSHSARDDAYSCKDLFLRASHELSFLGGLTLADCT